MGGGGYTHTLRTVTGMSLDGFALWFPLDNRSRLIPVTVCGVARGGVLGVFPHIEFFSIFIAFEAFHWFYMLSFLTLSPY